MNRPTHVIPPLARLTGFFRTCCVVLILSCSALAEPPSFDDAVGSWITAREWLDAGTLPGKDTPEAQLPVESLAGASVVLRLDGRTIGKSVEFGADDLLLRRVLGRAMTQALGDPTLRALPEAFRERATERLTLEIEFASSPKPLLGTQLGSAIARIQPGIDGIAMRRKEQWAYAFPGRAVATGTAGNVTSTILRLAADLGLPPRDLPELRQIDDIGLYRFNTLRMAQSNPEDLPFEAFRSGQVVARSDLDQDARKAFAESLIIHLNSHRPNDADIDQGAPVFLGDFDPVADRHNPLLAPPLERALVAWALAEAARCQVIDPAARTMAREDALYLLHSLQEPDLENPDLSLDVTCLAASALVSCEGPNEPVALQTLQRITPVLLQRSATESNSQRIQHAAALAAIPECIVPAATNESVRRWLDLAWADATPELLVTNLDWYAVAEHAYAQRMGSPATRVGLLRNTREVLSARREKEPLGNDLEGGIPLQSVAKDRIDARVLRLGVACALLEKIEPPQSSQYAREIVDGLVRFAIQLQMSEQDAYLFRGSRRAIGGVREAPWSPQQPLAAEAMALLLVTQTLGK